MAFATAISTWCSARPGAKVAGALWPRCGACPGPGRRSPAPNVHRRIRGGLAPRRVPSGGPRGALDRLLARYRDPAFFAEARPDMTARFEADVSAVLGQAGLDSLARGAPNALFAVVTAFGPGRWNLPQRLALAALGNALRPGPSSRPVPWALGSACCRAGPAPPWLRAASRALTSPSARSNGRRRSWPRRPCRASFALWRAYCLAAPSESMGHRGLPFRRHPAPRRLHPLSAFLPPPRARMVRQALYPPAARSHLRGSCVADGAVPGFRRGSARGQDPDRKDPRP